MDEQTTSLFVTDNFNFNKILIFINVVKNTKSRYPQLEFRDAVGAQSLSIAGFVRRLVRKLFIYLADNWLLLVFSERLQIRNRFESIFDVVHGRSGMVNWRSRTGFAVRKRTLHD